MTTTIELRALTKRFGSTIAVDELTANVHSGSVTAFLGPNGAGKTTTLRMLLGLIAPTTGTATIDGRRYDELSEPIREVGALLQGRAQARREATGPRSPGCASDRAPSGLDGTRMPRAVHPPLTAEADKKVGAFSLGMRQRLGLAAALLGEPPVLVLDEPNNGLDPQGIRWLRGYLRELAGRGSHGSRFQPRAG